MATEAFELDRPTYSPRQVCELYSRYVRKVSYPTVLEWIQVYEVTKGKEGVKAGQSPRSRRYVITAEEVERILLQAGATKKGS